MSLGRLGILSAGLFVIGLFLFLLFAPFTVVSPGYVGVVTLFGKVADQPLPAGFHLMNPMSDVDEMSVQIEKAHAKFDAASKDLQHVAIVMTVNYQLDSSEAPRLFREVGLNYLQKIVEPAAAEVLKSQIALHNASEILKQRPEIKHTVQEGLSVWLKKYGLLVREISLSDVTFGAEYQRAIEAKQLEEQKAEQKRYELLQAQAQAEIVAAEAKGQADAMAARARGEADSLKLKGEAQAEYNRRVAESLTPALLAAHYYEKWNGVLPQTMLAGEANTLLQLPAR
jgi:prohibitin 2